MAHKMGAEAEDSAFGRLLMAVGVPMCYALGRAQETAALAGTTTLVGFAVAAAALAKALGHHRDHMVRRLIVVVHVRTQVITYATVCTRVVPACRFW